MVFDVFLLKFKMMKTHNFEWEYSFVILKSLHRYNKMNQKSYFTWTEDKKYTLAKLALRYEGYKSSDKPHNEKWETIPEKLKTKPEFSDLEIQPIALQNHFKRMQKDALKAAGISMEGANLSGLPEEPKYLRKKLLVKRRRRSRKRRRQL